MRFRTVRLLIRTHIPCVFRTGGPWVTYSSFGPGPRYAVNSDHVVVASGRKPESTQCRQNANFGSSGVGASGSVNMKLYECIFWRAASAANAIVGACLHSPARKNVPRSTAFSPKLTSSFVVGRNPSGMRPAADPGTRFAFASDVVRAAE